MASVLIDWLTVTSDLDLIHSLEASKFNFRLSSELPRLAHYADGWQLEPAGKYYSSKNSRQGAMVTFGGQDLQTLRERSHDDGSALTEIATLGSVTRLDFAIDIFQDVSLRDLELFIETGQYQTTFKTPPRRMDGFGESSGYTLYFGSPKGDRQVRVYDKAAQMKLLSLAWSRIELQARRKRANQISSDMLAASWEQVGKAAIQDCLDFPQCQWWSEALTNSSDELSQIPKQEPHWQKWIRTQVEPSIENHMRGTKDRQFIAEFLHRLAEAMDAFP